MEQIPTEVMEKIEKESECRYPVKTHQSPDNSPYLSSQITFKHGVYFGLSLCEGKEKEIAELREQYSIMDVRRRNAIKSLEESEKQFGEQQQEIERLKGLIENAFYLYTMPDFPTETEWQQFKTENNL